MKKLALGLLAAFAVSSAVPAFAAEKEGEDAKKEDVKKETKKGAKKGGKKGAKKAE